MAVVDVDEQVRFIREVVWADVSAAGVDLLC